MCSAPLLDTLHCKSVLPWVSQDERSTLKKNFFCIVLLSLVGKNEGEEKRELIFKEDGQGGLFT